jgi:heme-degrading monooxygenase HmoA
MPTETMSDCLPRHKDVPLNRVGRLMERQFTLLTAKKWTKERIVISSPRTHIFEDWVATPAYQKTNAGLSIADLSLSAFQITKIMTSASPLAETPSPPYYAVIFSSRRTRGDHGYGRMAERMVNLAREIPGFLGVESVRGDGGVGITVSYWNSQHAIRKWKAQLEHRGAQALGKKLWYSDYIVRVAKVERAYRKLSRRAGSMETAGENRNCRDADTLGET